MLKILFADDDLKYSLFLKKFLEKEGYEVVHVTNGKSALEQYLVFHPDLILLDINMPEIDGFEVARHIREQDKKVLLFFLSDRTEKTDRLKGFSLKGNDYISKPFYPEELIAKIKERFTEAEKSIPLLLGRTVFSPDINEVNVCGTIHTITSRQSEILVLLVSHLNNLVDRDMLLNRIWGNDSYSNSLALNVQITYLRKILSDDTTISIDSIKKKGYILRKTSEN
ncbi:MAG: response regulator transcription factor [Parabacteroides sp.]|mgnify:CR=1 FL=1|nr:response regulator transcription factor [Parabacteroides sp.]